MTDEQMIERIAASFVQSGGDADGFLYVMYRIHKRIAELTTPEREDGDGR